MSRLGAAIGDAGTTTDEAAPLERVPLVDRESAAWGASLLVHLTAFAALAAFSLSLPAGDARLELAPLEVFGEADLPHMPQEFASSDQPQETPGALSAMGEASALGSAPQFSEQPLVGGDFQVVAEVGEPGTVSVDLATLTGPELLSSIPVQGVGSVGLTGAAGAVDRLTHEVLASLEQRPTLVVWLFDQSGSLQGERSAILQRFRRIYDELDVAQRALEQRQSKPSASDAPPLLTAMMAFGARPTLLTAKPTARFADLEAAVASIKDDKTGQENVFSAVGAAATKFRPYLSARHGRRRVMIVVFTDEAGDDEQELDATAETCRKFGMPVYVVGRPAPFGRDTAYVKWIDPDPRYDQRPQWAPVRLGPESAAPELLKLRFGDRGEEELLDSGFGPYALTRLCYVTGGLYFATHPNRVVGRSVSGAETNNLAAHFAAFFDPEVMRRYQPDYVSLGEYARQVEGSAMRRALIQAAQLSWTSPMGGVRTRFPKRDEAELARDLTQAQRAAAVVAPKIDLICEILLAGRNDRPDESEARWQAGYDLALGRALAVKARADGYNVMLAAVKQGTPFERPKSNTWILRPADQYVDSKVEKLAAQAKEYLQRVKRDHPGTPWAVHAERELRTPLGWRWEEGYSRLAPQPQDDGRMPPRPEPEPPPGPPRRDPPPL